MKRYIVKTGYIRLHDKQFKNNWKSEHRYVMEQFLGRELNSTELVHHKNGNKSDNRIDNLIIESFSEHSYHHIKSRFPNINSGQWSEKFKECIKCGKNDKPMAKKGICFRCYDRNYHTKIRRLRGEIPIKKIHASWGFSNRTKELFKFCIKCKSNKHKYCARGLCVSCYDKIR